MELDMKPYPTILRGGGSGLDPESNRSWIRNWNSGRQAGTRSSSYAADLHGSGGRLRPEYLELVRALDLPLPGTGSASSCYALGGGAHG